MSDFVAAIGLVLVIEGVFYGGFPGIARKLAQEASSMPDQPMRLAGVVAAAAGVFVVWLVRG